MPTSEPAEPIDAPARIRRSGVFGVLRSFVRQLAAAVYVYVAYVVGLRFVGIHRMSVLLEPLLVLLGAGVVGWVVEGPWWMSSFVGLCVGAFDLATTILLGDPHMKHLNWRLGVWVALIVAVGVAGGWVGRRVRKRPTPA